MRGSRRIAGTLTALALTSIAGGCSQSAPVTPAEPPLHGTYIGSTLQRLGGEDYQQARRRLTAQWGRLPIVRYFDPGPPDPWPVIRARVGVGVPVVVSFKLPPAGVLTGEFDGLLQRWFEAAPTTVRTFWSYLAEPEDDIASGDYTAAQFRAAWRHIAALAAQSQNPALDSTLVLMCYTLKPASGRDWRDYYPGADSVDVLAWDCYNRAAREGRYEDPRRLLGPAQRLTHRLGLPFAIAEVGSTLIAADDGAGRAAWLLRLARYALTTHAVFLTYFNSDVGGDYRLEDEASIAAWREAISWTHH